MNITPLGTVSPYCKGNKNCAGFLIENNRNKILLDCGSGISRFLKFPNDLNNLIIVISHLHKDHYSDLSSIAYASFVYKNLGLLKERIKVYIPFDESSFDFKCLNNFGEENYLEIIPYITTDIIQKDDVTITFKKNPHPILTNSIKVSTNKHSLVYSSDTGYKNNSLETFAKNVDLLICESTFLKEQVKTHDHHLYAYEAALIAKKAQVKKLALTHFWPEINKQEYVNEAKQIFSKTIYCEENEIIDLR